METEQKGEALSPQQKASMAQTESQKLLDLANNFKIKKVEDLETATEMLANIKKLSKAVKEQKDPVLKGLKMQIKVIGDWFRPTEEKLKEAENNIKDQVLNYHAIQQRRAEKKAERIEAKVEAGEISEVQAESRLEKIVEPIKTVKTASGGVQIRKVKRVRILDPLILPVEYLTRESVIEALRKEVANDVLRGGKECPGGAEVFEEDIAAGVTR